MGQVSVEIGGRTYQLSCRDGEETHLQGLAAALAEKAASLTVSLGQLSEPRLLLMSALMMADELYDVKRGVAPASPPAPMPDDRLTALVARVEALAGRLEA